MIIRNEELKKYEVLIDNVKYTINDIWWDYPQTDSESSGATDDNVMYRDVLPRRVKVGFLFQNPSQSLTSQILEARKKKECLVNYWDLETGDRIERKMYPTCDQVNAKILFNNNDGEEEFVCDDIELRFTQMIPDEFM